MVWCDVASSWTVQGDNNETLDDVVVYTVDGSSDRQSAELSPNGITLCVHPSDTLLTSTETESDSPSSATKPCILTLSSRRHNTDTVLIASVDVLCDARRGEVFSSTGEYITTVDGTRVDEDIGLDRKLYMLQHSLQQPISRCSIKLVSCSEPHCVWVHSIYITITTTPMTTQSLTHDLGIGSSIDLDEVRSRLNDTGRELPDKARKLLNSLEMFQKARQSTPSSMMGLPTAPTSSERPGQMAALMAMFSGIQMHQYFDFDGKSDVKSPQFDSATKNPTQSSRQTPDPNTSQSESSDALGDENVDEASPDRWNSSNDMKSKCSNQVPTAGTVTNQEGPSNACAKDEFCDKDTISSICGNANPINLLLNLEQRFHKAMQETEERIMGKVSDELSAMECRIQTKLDVILSRLAPPQDTISQEDYAPNYEEPETKKDIKDIVGIECVPDSVTVEDIYEQPSCAPEEEDS